MSARSSDTRELIAPVSKMKCPCLPFTAALTIIREFTVVKLITVTTGTASIACVGATWGNDEASVGNRTLRERRGYDRASLSVQRQKDREYF